MTIEDGILDPAHDDDGGVETAIAGVPKPEPKDDKPQPKVSEDGNIVEIGDKKYITEAALRQEREKRQELANTLAQLDPVMPEFEEFLRQRQGRRGATVERARGDHAESDYTEDELEGFAITRGYYKEDNATPDLARAQKELDIISGINRRQVRREVEPMARGTKAEMARANRERAHANRFVDGKPVADQKYLDAALNSLDADHLADPNVANMAQVIAAGLEYLDMRKNGTLGRGPVRRGDSDEPMFLERGSGRLDDDHGEMSALDAAAARARGKTPEQWAKLSKQVNASRRNSAVLEDV